MIEVISVHFPKAAGSSLRQSLLSAYGENAVCFDYQDDPSDPCSQFNLDPERCRRRATEMGCSQDLKVVHGHFHPSKYDGLQAARRITFLRHPVENLVSIHLYWKNQHSGHELFNYVRREQLEIRELARIPTLRYLFTRTFFGGVDMDRFAFIGFQDDYTAGLKRLSSLLEAPLVEALANVNENPESLQMRESY